MTATTSIPISASTSTSKFKNIYFLNFMRTVWWFVAILGVLLFIYLLPSSFDSATKMPTTLFEQLPDTQTHELFLEGLSIFHIPPVVYASYKILLEFIIMAVSYGMGYLIFRTRFDERIGMIAAFCFMASGAFMAFPPNFQSDTSTLAGALIEISGWILAIFTWGGFYLFLILYPDGRFKPIWSIISPLIWLLGIIGMLFPQTGLDVFNDNNAELPLLGIVMLLLMFGLPLIAQIYRYFRIFSPLQRQQTKWFLLVLAWLIFVIFILQPLWSSLDRSQPLNLVIVDFLDGMLNLSFLLLPLAVGMAILRYRLWDIDLVINKSLVYGFALALAIGLFMLAMVALQVIIGQSQPLTALVIAGAFSAVLFKPAQKQIQNFVDRRIYRLNFNLNELAAAQKDREITKPGAMTGKTLSGYELGNLIGKGGMGEIYKGFKDNQSVAIKTLLPELAQDKELLVRFQREAETGQHLRHRNIAEVYSSGELDGTPYLIMEYIDGQDLRSLLKQEGKFDEETTRQIIQNICAALDMAHAEGFVHRDIKPANIMLRDNGEAVLMDFGVTKVKAGHTITGTGAIGTIDYMAPEQIMSAKTVDQRADIYALGIVAFELLTGEKPFKGSAAQVMFAHIQQPPPYARDINPDIPEKLAEAIEKAMSKKPEDRFASAGDFAKALK